MENTASTITPTVCPTYNKSLLPPPSFPGLELALLRSNIPPSSTERRHMCQILEIEKDQLKLYGEELDCRVGIAKKLREERSCLERRIRERESWLAGIRRLPVEILTEIFSIFCSMYDHALAIYNLDDEDRDKYYTVVSDPTLALSQVSHHWRQVAVSCPHLWSSIDVEVRRPVCDYGGILAAYLENSASHPLQIRICDSRSWITCLDYRRFDLGANGVSIVETILLHSARIQVLTFDGFRIRYGILRHSQYAFPLLREFTATTEFDLPGHSGLLKSLNEAPLLNTFSTKHLDDSVVLPYSRLTSLTLGDMTSINSFYGLLQKCSNLRKLVINRYFRIERDAQPIELPSLRTLSIRTDVQANLPRQIKFPNLRIFVVVIRPWSLDEEEHEWRSPAFRFILQSCSSTLRRLSLTLTRRTVTSLTASQVLELVSTQLSYLQIRVSRDTTGFTEELLSLLTVPNSAENRTTVFVPELRQLRVTVLHGEPLHTEKVANLIVDMIMSRSKKRLLDNRISVAASALAIAFFDLRHPSAAGDGEMGGIQDKSCRFLEIINAAPLDPDMSLRTLVGLRT
ncbi:hypothetical protein E1B28_002937 [Marasmius oreades]|uniref:F-box domain-containing protein n=1 Tax=Marasmius oreades TaxID=181124 RepID=A0A9P7RK80_9AGAR|nr:uncharacterized protein E1B28_002937 [Marasmius oreades]KAG7085374.1 hypothetical protein E1B28_002937 [Marasmius oreades]